VNSRSMRWTPEQLADFKSRAGVKIAPVKSKYGAKKTVFNGRKYDSAKEAKHAEELQLLLKAKEISELQEQVRFQLVVNDELICAYIADFTYWKGGKFTVSDVKGMRKGQAYQMFRLKAKLMKAIYGIEVVEI
jgi:hypothetical protein